MMSRKGRFTDLYGSLYPQDEGFTWSNDNLFAREGTLLPDRRIDYIYTRDLSTRLKPEDAEVVFSRPNEKGIFASDHFGLLGTFKE
jgi:endonuclease/exonuclease/phosphatase (EEP) superfamily protein YafD